MTCHDSSNCTWTGMQSSDGFVYECYPSGNQIACGIVGWDGESDGCHANQNSRHHPTIKLPCNSVSLK